jgi:hypothetical protein
MSKQSTVRIDRYFDNKLEQVDRTIEDAVGQKLTEIAQTIVHHSPVDTGAYVTSHSVKSNTSSRGRRKSSKNKPKALDKQGKKAEGLGNLIEDIQALDLENNSRFTFRNDSPHAQAVEKREHIYGAIVRNIHG